MTSCNNSTCVASREARRLLVAIDRPYRASEHNARKSGCSWRAGGVGTATHTDGRAGREHGRGECREHLVVDEA
jgi:hypothetical protein